MHVEKCHGKVPHKDHPKVSNIWTRRRTSSLWWPHVPSTRKTSVCAEYLMRNDICFPAGDVCLMFGNAFVWQFGVFRLVDGWMTDGITPMCVLQIGVNSVIRVYKDTYQTNATSISAQSLERYISFILKIMQCPSLHSLTLLGADAFAEFIEYNYVAATDVRRLVSSSSYL